MGTMRDKEKFSDPAQAESQSMENHSITKGDDLLRLEHTDPVLNAKMHLVNNVSSFVQLLSL